ncbi:MAG: ABC transporter ATP-binding protein [Deltaproteobacteria bacterium]|nr:ABC transporter ATP-binding protein [Deltaproteobacteria bacterium]
MSHPTAQTKSGQLLPELWSLVAPHWRSILMLGFLALVESGLNIAGSALFRIVGDSGMASSTLRLTMPLAGLSVLVAIFLISTTISYLGDLVGVGISAEARGRTLGRLLEMPLSWLQRSASASVASRLTMDLGWIRVAITHIYRDLFAQPIILAALAVYLSTLSWSLLLLALALLPGVLLPLWWIGRRTAKTTQILVDEAASRAALQQDYLSKTALLTVTGAGPLAADRYRKAETAVTRAWKRYYGAAGLSRLVGVVLASAAAAVVIVVGYGHLSAGRLTLGRYLAFLAGLALFFRAAGRLAGQLSSMSQAMGALSRVLVMQQQIRLTPRPRTQTPPQGAEPTLRIKGMSFSYDDQSTLPARKDMAAPPQDDEGNVHNADRRSTPDGGPTQPLIDSVDLEATPGTLTLLVGPSGSGKSTLLSIALGLRAPQQGTVELAGVPTQTIDTTWLARHVGYLDQEASVLDDTIRFNLELGLDLPDSALWNALDVVHLGELVRGLPDGLDATIGENGQRLSTGQRRRLALARCLARGPEIFILDEPFSALDPTVTQTVVATIERLVEQGKTLLVASHQRQDFSSAASVYLIEDNQIRRSE